MMTNEEWEAKVAAAQWDGWENVPKVVDFEPYQWHVGDREWIFDTGATHPEDMLIANLDSKYGPRVSRNNGRTLAEARELRANNKIKAQAKDLLSCLTAKQNKVVRLRLYENWTFQEIAAKMGYTRQAASDCYHKAIRRMQKHAAKG